MQRQLSNVLSQYDKNSALPSAANQNLPDGRWVPCGRFSTPFFRAPLDGREVCGPAVNSGLPEFD